MSLPRSFEASTPLSSFLPMSHEALAADPASELVVLQMTVPPQVKDEWCWAAVCAGVREAFEQVSEEPCRLAGEVLNIECCLDPDSCNKAMFLSIALERLGYFVSPIEAQLDFGEIADEIRAGRPVCCFIDYGTQIGHFIVISAIDPALESVGILDPAPSGPHTVPQFMPLESLRAAYGLGRWMETYRTKPRI